MLGRQISLDISSIFIDYIICPHASVEVNAVLAIDGLYVGYGVFYHHRF